MGTFQAPRPSIAHEDDIPPLGAGGGMTVPDTSEIAGFDQVPRPEGVDTG